jgi:ATP-dependent DNA helicase Rep
LLIQEHGGDGDQVELIQAQISNWKNELVGPEQALAYAQNPTDILCAQAYMRYQRMLKAYNAFDFDDLILTPAALFRDNPEVLARWQQRIRYLLVDEYQDTNGAQYQLVKQLLGGRNGLTVVGDDDQSIYAWRGARPENLALLQDDYPHLKVVKLEQNYRSTANILQAANAVIGNNPHVFEKTLWSEFGPGEPIRIIGCANETDECERVVMEILDHKLRYRARFGDYAVLYRGNHQAKLLEIQLQQHQIPYRLSGGTSFFARNEIKDVMAYLRLLVNPDDDTAFLRIINVPRRKIGASTLEGLGTYATLREISLLAGCDEMGLSEYLPENAIARLREFSGWLDRVRRNVFEGDALVAIREMLEDIDYLGWLHQLSSSVPVAEGRWKNVVTLIESLGKQQKEAAEEDEREEFDIEQAIARLVLRDILDRQEEEDETLDRVQLMTLHAAKGLEFPHAYMIGMEEDLLPHRNSIEQNTIEEERRLCYVGITRARKNLTLTYAKKRKQFGETGNTTPSRFLAELPENLIHWEGRGDATPEQNAQRAKQTLGGLKNLLADL